MSRTNSDATLFEGAKEGEGDNAVGATDGDTQLPDGEQLLTTEQVTRYLRISKTTLKRRRAAGMITPVPHHAAVQWAPLLFRRSDVERLKGGI